MCNRRVNVELAGGRGSRVRDTPREHSQTFSAWALGERRGLSPEGPGLSWGAGIETSSPQKAVT